MIVGSMPSKVSITLFIRLKGKPFVLTTICTLGIHSFRSFTSSGNLEWSVGSPPIIFITLVFRKNLSENISAAFSKEISSFDLIFPYIAHFASGVVFPGD